MPTDIGNFETTQTLETFGFLPKMDQNEIQAQVAYILANGWSPAIEHEHPSKSFDHYWTWEMYWLSWMPVTVHSRITMYV
jgi:ribulose-bisphosphate carboxylase small chain